MDTARRSTKRLSTAKELAQVVAAYYLECHQARVEGRPIGWMPPMNGGIEIFYAMGLQPVFPENWSPVCAAFGLTPANFEVSEGMGYSRDLCGYLRNITGYVHGDMNGPSVPLSGLPVPDMIMSFGGGCIPAMKIFHILENRFPEAKVFRADIPQVAVEDIRDHHVDYAVSEMHRFIEFLERTTNRRLDRKSSTRRSRCPMKPAGSGTRSCPSAGSDPRRFRPRDRHMFVMVTRQGTKTAVDFLTGLRRRGSRREPLRA
jgi:benzoyl-CoA reductase/2-hydroxyglutaryl-CoA dehydratase subunit BcrC/BadD/HgdB